MCLSYENVLMIDSNIKKGSAYEGANEDRLAIRS